MIPYGKHYIDEDDIQAVTDVLRSGSLTQGPMVEKFEKAIAKYVGAKYAVAVSSGTAGLHIAALAAGIGPGDSLITSPMSFVASANTALYVGAKPVFSDIDNATINLSPNILKNTLLNHSNARAVIPVHFAGLACDMAEIKKVADKSNILIIEDAAHALGAKYPNGQRVGCCSHSLMTVFSFHPVKAIAAGEGGMVTTNDESIYHELLRLRSHGINKLSDQYQIPEQAEENGVSCPWYYEMQELGFNYRITDIQCGLALSQLNKLEKFLIRRRDLVRKYDEAFLELPNCRPAQSSGRDISGHHIYVLRIDFKKLKMSRAELMSMLKESNVGTQVHYIPLPAHPYYRNLGFVPEDYPNALDYYNEALTIPLFYEMTDNQQQLVINTFKELLK
jgi:perosamine synthetase